MTKPIKADVTNIDDWKFEQFKKSLGDMDGPAQTVAWFAWVVQEARRKRC